MPDSDTTNSSESSDDRSSESSSQAEERPKLRLSLKKPTAPTDPPDPPTSPEPEEKSEGGVETGKEDSSEPPEGRPAIKLKLNKESATDSAPEQAPPTEDSDQNKAPALKIRGFTPSPAPDRQPETSPADPRADPTAPTEPLSPSLAGQNASALTPPPIPSPVTDAPPDSQTGDSTPTGTTAPEEERPESKPSGTAVLVKGLAVFLILIAIIGGGIYFVIKAFGRDEGEPGISSSPTLSMLQESEEVLPAPSSSSPVVRNAQSRDGPHPASAVTKSETLPESVPPAPTESAKGSSMPTQDPTVAAFVDRLNINAVKDSGSRPLIMVDQGVVRAGGILNEKLGIQFIGVDRSNQELIFQDTNGVRYFRPY